MTTWDDLFEASPADDDEAKYGAAKMRELKAALSEREELEHNFKTGTKPFHKAGKCAVFYSGTTIEIAALTGMSEGSIAFDTTLGVLQRFDGNAWATQTMSHGKLTDLDADSHPQYLHLTTAGQTITENIAVTAGKTIDGRDISDDMGKLDTLVSLETDSLALVFDSGTKEIRRTAGSFVTDGFAEGDIIRTTSTDNPGPFYVASVTATIITVLEAISDATVTGKVFIMDIGFDDWAETYLANTEYGPEIRDCFISATGITAEKTNYMRGYIGAASADTLIMTAYADDDDDNRPVGLCMPVKKGMYWKVTYTNITYTDITRMQVK